MIQKLRRKFILILMGVVSLVLVAVFVSLLLSTWGASRRQSNRMLAEALQQPVAAQGFHVQSEGPMSLPMQGRVPMIVAEIGADGTVLLTNGMPFLDTDAALRAVAAVAAQPGQSGTLREQSLRWAKSGDGARIALVDIVQEQMILRNLIVNALLVGAAALTALYFISVALARWATRPVETAWNRQQQFVADASHELKTPLTVILSNAEMLAETTRGDDKKSRRLGHIQAEAQRMRRLVEDLLVLAKSDDAAGRSVHSAVDFSDLVTSTALAFESVIFDAGRTLTTAVQPSLTVQGDAGRLQQLVGTLLDNAIKYGAAGGEIRLTLAEGAKKTVLLTVSNDGDPIPKEALASIFLRFYRADKARSASGSFGLGLAIAERITAEHGGKIWAESGETGNSFYVQIPE